MYELNLAFTNFLFVVVLIWFFTRPYASIFHPITYYLFFHGLVFVVRPVFAHYYEMRSIYDLFRFYPDMNVKNWALIAANVGLISFLVPTALLANRPITFTDIDREPRAGGQLIIAFILCLPLIGISMWYLLSGKLGEFGGDAIIQMTRDAVTRIAINQNTNGYINDANTMMGPFTVLIAWAFRFRPVALIPFAIFVALRMYNGWGRWTFVLTSVSLLLLYLYDHRSRWPGMKSVVIGCALLGIFFVLGTNREFLQQLILGTPGPVRRVERHFFDNMDFANLEYLEFVIRAIPDMSGTYDYFLNNLQLLTEPIPRIFWPGKPVGPPIQMFNYFDYGFPIGFTVSLPGHGWAQFGLFGVIIWCAMGGAIWGGFYRWFINTERSRFQVGLFCVALPVSVQWFRDGVMVTLVKFLLFVVLPVFVWFVVCRVLPPLQERIGTRSHATGGLPAGAGGITWPARRFGRQPPSRSA